MSDILEKTFSALPNLLTAALTGRNELLTEGTAAYFLKKFMKSLKDVTTKRVRADLSQSFRNILKMVNLCSGSIPYLFVLGRRGFYKPTIK